jgi:hypothetical protein
MKLGVNQFSSSWIHHQFGRRGVGLGWPGGQRTEWCAKTELPVGFSQTGI